MDFAGRVSHELEQLIAIPRCPYSVNSQLEADFCFKKIQASTMLHLILFVSISLHNPGCLTSSIALPGDQQLHRQYDPFNYLSDEFPAHEEFALFQVGWY